MRRSKKPSTIQEFPGTAFHWPEAVAGNSWSSPKDGKSDARLDFRLTREQKQLIEDAACLLGQTVSDFATRVLVERALELTQRSRVTALSNRDWEFLLRLLDSNAEPNAALKRAAKRYKKQYG